jgi:hypothetical protein
MERRACLDRNEQVDHGSDFKEKRDHDSRSVLLSKSWQNIVVNGLMCRNREVITLVGKNLIRKQ